MTAHVVIAARGGPDAKSRLAGRLRPSQRAALVEAMLADMLQILVDSPTTVQLHVTTPTPALARIAARVGAIVVLEPASSDLNAAFESARRRIAAHEPGAPVVLLPGDLPLLDPRDLDLAIAAAKDGGVALAAAAADGGTAAVALRADSALPLAFGADSFDKHLAAAAALGLEPLILDAPSLALDVDRPEDLDAVISAGRGRTAALLRGWKAAA